MDTAAPSLPNTPSGYNLFDEYIAQRTMQGERYHYALALPLAQVPATLPVPDPEQPLDDNRQVKLSHAQGFANYIRQNPDWHAGPLTVRTTSGVVKFETFPGGEYDTIAVGMVKVPRNQRSSFRIVDGQHRVLGIYLALTQCNEELVKAKSLLDKAKRNGEPDQAIQMLQKKVSTLSKQIDRLQTDSIFVDLIVEDDQDKARQIFVDVANNALGITKAVTKRFDSRSVVNRSLNILLDEDIALLKGNVDIQKDRITGSNPNLLGASHLGDVIRTIEVGIGGRVSRVMEETLDEYKLADNTRDFLEVATSGFSDLEAIATGQKAPQDLRATSLVVLTTMLRVLAGVYHDLKKKGRSDAEVVTFFKKLDSHMEAPVTSKTASGKLWLNATKSEAFSEGATAPGARAQQVRELVGVIVEWEGNPPAGL